MNVVNADLVVHRTALDHDHALVTEVKRLVSGGLALRVEVRQREATGEEIPVTAWLLKPATRAVVHHGLRDLATNHPAWPAIIPVVTALEVIVFGP